MLPLTSWVLLDSDHSLESYFSEKLGILPITAKILANRNLTSLDQAEQFLSPSLSSLHNPFLLRDMEQGIDRAVGAINNNENITVYGDYDADGITSTALLILFFRACGKNISYYIPDRINEGYGLNNNAIEYLKNNGTSLIITVDCGISDSENISYARSLGIDVIVIDHHEIQTIPSDAVSVINPHRQENDFPFSELAGVGVTFNFLIALRGRLRDCGFWNDKSYPNLKQYLDLVALGTIADIVPLIDENRIFTKFGLDCINNSPRTGLRALITVSGLDHTQITSETAAYTLIPRINASGRIGSPRDAVDLLTTDDHREALELSEKLDSYNQKRKKIENGILDEILALISSRSLLESNRALVLASADWHPGVIGIVASRLVDRFYRPSILFNIRDGICKGSGRSISEFDLYRGLCDYCSEFLLTFGGHRYAAGLSVPEESLDIFASNLDKAVTETMREPTFAPRTLVDALCSLEEIDYSLIRQLSSLEPFGNANPEPVLCARDTTVTSPNIVGRNHLKMKIAVNGIVFDSIWFNMGAAFSGLTDTPHDIVFTPQLNYWNNRTTIQLKVKDMSTANTHSSQDAS